MIVSIVLKNNSIDPTTMLPLSMKVLHFHMFFLHNQLANCGFCAYWQHFSFVHSIFLHLSFLFLLKFFYCDKSWNLKGFLWWTSDPLVDSSVFSSLNGVAKVYFFIRFLGLAVRKYVFRHYTERQNKVSTSSCFEFLSSILVKFKLV